MFWSTPDISWMYGYPASLIQISMKSRADFIAMSDCSFNKKRESLDPLATSLAISFIFLSSLISSSSLIIKLFLTEIKPICVLLCYLSHQPVDRDLFLFCFLSQFVQYITCQPK